jgi:5-methylthioadenosine/S-adenosylhomocysteine deaminase
MACRDGATAFGQADLIGSLDVGRRADVVVVDLDTVFTAPVHRVPSALVFCASPAQVTHVIVDGRILIDDGALTMLDEAALRAEAAASAREVFILAGIDSRITR